MTALIVVVGCLPASALGAPAPLDASFGVGGTAGYRVYRLAATASTARWRPLATIRPTASGDDRWLGYQCLSGDGRWIAALVAPRHAVDVPALRDRGAALYRVDARTGAVRLLALGIGFKYHTLGCGGGDRLVVTRSLGTDQTATEVLELDLASGRVLRRVRVSGQLTSVVPTDEGLVGTMGDRIVRVGVDGLRTLAAVPGLPYDLRPASHGVDLLATRGRAAAEVLELRGRRLRVVGRGRREDLGLVLGARRRNVVIDGEPTTATHRSSLRWSHAPVGTTVAGASRDGAFVLVQRSLARVAAGASADVAVLPDVRPTPAGSVMKAAVARGAGRRYVGLRSAAVPQRPRARQAVNTTTPKCAVPRNSVTRQVPQPSSQQVDWAIQEAVRGALKGTTLTRPSNFLNLGLSAYQPSLDFAPGSLQGGTGAVVPPAVVQALYAQESNWWQASFHALPGVAGNPLIADYYGSAGGISSIDYDQADCGYGISQLTDGMTASSTLLSANGKTKVAVDYAENIAAGLQTLIAKWNQLAQAGVTVNGGDPQYLENWYFALWAYNTGFHANTGSGPWGLGWTNNPQNSDYPPSRTPFLRTSYADAEHPGDWPYQERVLGFMESPLLNYKGHASYASSPSLAQPPSYSLFCTAGDDCSPTYHDPVDSSKDYCTRADRECWWHSPVTWTTCSASCHQGQFTYATTDPEPIADATYLPQCSSDLSSAAIIVDDEPTDLNVRGCGSSNWSSQGSFAIAHGQDAAGTAVGQIDWHQLGTGFGGHTYFTHSRAASDTAHVETGTWTPPVLTAGSYAIAVHVPVSGATTTAATYRIYPGDGTSQTVTISQHVGGNQWVPLGDFALRPTGVRVVLTNSTSETPGSTDVAYDAVAFTFIRSPKPTDANLAATFQPQLLFDSSEKWRPLNLATLFAERDASGQPLHRRCLPYDSPDADTLLGITQFPTTPGPDDYSVPVSGGGGVTYVPVARCASAGSIADATTWRSGDAYVDLQQLGPSTDQGDFSSPDSRCHVGILLDCNGDEIAGDDKSAIYYYVTETSGYAYVQYWIFYRYNSYSDSVAEGKHEGDWEAVAVAPSLDGDTFDFASFSQHGDWFSYLRSNLQCADQSDHSCGSDTVHRGQRVVDYVANGDHANYPSSCHEVVPELTCERGTGAPERGYDGADPWGHDADGAGLLAMPAPGTESWTDWPGHWGATGTDPFKPGVDSPKSPAAQSMFDRPWGGCGSNDAGCATPARVAGSAPVRASVAVAARSCDSWLGGGVAAVACAPQLLGQAVRHRALGPDGWLRLRVVRGGARTEAARSWHGASANGVSQLMGAPLERGDRIAVVGAAPRGTVLQVRVRVGRRAVRTLRLALPAGARSGSTALVRGSRSHPRLVLER